MASLALALVSAGSARSEEILIGRSTSVSRTRPDWRTFLSGDMRELTSHSESTTEFDPDTKPVSIAGITLDVRGQSPIHSEATTRAVARRGDPEWGMVRLESVSTTADGQVIKTQYSLKLPSPDAPIVIGPVGGGEMSLPPRVQAVAGKELVFRSAPRLTEIRALLVAPTFDDLLAGSELREVRVPGTRVETGSMRVLASDGTAIGYYAGDVRVLRNEEYVSQK